MTRPNTAVLLILCRDQPGLVDAVSDFLYRNNGNIIHADQHTDQAEGLFLQRVEWSLDGFALSRDAVAAAFEPIAARYQMRWSLRFGDDTLRVAILVSKLQHCLYDLLTRWRLGELHAEIAFIASNHDDAAAVAEEFGLPFHHLPVSAETRPAQEARLTELIEQQKVDLVVLARYMQILSDGFVAQYERRIINIHHSFLPAFVGARPYEQAFARGVKIIGATAHYATAELDQGPIIEQDVVRVSHRDSVDDLVRKGRDLEKIVLARAVDLHLRNRVLVYGNKTVVFD